MYWPSPDESENTAGDERGQDNNGRSFVHQRPIMSHCMQLADEADVIDEVFGTEWTQSSASRGVQLSSEEETAADVFVSSQMSVFRRGRKLQQTSTSSDSDP